MKTLLQIIFSGIVAAISPSILNHNFLLEGTGEDAPEILD